MNPTVTMYISQGVHGIAYGMILFLISSGLTLIFGMMGILTLAHAAFFMLSAYLGYQVLAITGNFWLALLLAPVFTAFLGVIMERIFLRKFYAYGHTSQLILTQGVAMIILAAVQIFWGTTSHPLPPPAILQGMVSITGMDYPIYRLFIIGLSLAVMIFMILLLYRTRIGKIVRAAVSDRDMVNALGININLVFMVVFGFGTWLAGIAGVAIAPVMTVFPGLSEQVGLDGFIVVVTAGLGSLKGAFIVSILFGLLSSYGIQFVSQLAPVLMLGFMSLVLVFRPSGLFGSKE